MTLSLKTQTFLAVAIATRADCINDEIIDYLNSQNKEVWLELGLQSVHESTMERCNRKHSTQIVFDWLDKLKDTNIKTCVHIINGLPGEAKQDMLETVKQISKHPCRCDQDSYAAFD